MGTGDDMKTHADVACNYCLSRNTIEIGVQFYDAIAWWKCGVCNRHMTTRALTMPLAIPEGMELPDTQTGKNCKERDRL